MNSRSNLPPGCTDHDIDVACGANKVICERCEEVCQQCDITEDGYCPSCAWERVNTHYTYFNGEDYIINYRVSEEPTTIEIVDVCTERGVIIHVHPADAVLEHAKREILAELAALP